MAARGVGSQKILGKYFPGTTIRNERVASQLNGNQPSDSTAEGAEKLMSVRQQNLSVPLRNSPRPLRLHFLSHHAITKKPSIISSEHFRVTYPAVEWRDMQRTLNI